MIDAPIDHVAIVVKDLDAALRRLRSAIAAYPDLANFMVEIQLQAALAGDGLTELPRARLRRVDSRRRILLSIAALTR